MADTNTTSTTNNNTTSTASSFEEQRVARQSEQHDKVYKALVEYGEDSQDPATLDWAVAIVTGY